MKESMSSRSYGAVLVLAAAWLSACGSSGSSDDTSARDLAEGQPNAGGAVGGGAGGDAGVGGQNQGNAGEGNQSNGGSAGEGGAPPLPGSPRILVFSTNTKELSPRNGPLHFTAIVTDPDGISDLIGGSLFDPETGASYGAFATSAEEGAYATSIDWNAINVVRKIDASPSGVNRVFQARFFDVAGNSTTAEATVSLSCGASHLTSCSGDCVDLDTDSDNCGQCNEEVLPRTVCRNGESACTDSGKTLCGNDGSKCYYLSQDPNNCGSCGNQVPPEAQCRNGTAQCSDGPNHTPRTVCGTKCVDLKSDASNCGTCGKVSPTGICVDGKPSDCPNARETKCGSTCTYLGTDIHHCGACNNDCIKLANAHGVKSDNAQCLEGQCVLLVRTHNSYATCATACADEGLTCKLLENPKCYGAGAHVPGGSPGCQLRATDYCENNAYLGSCNEKPTDYYGKCFSSYQTFPLKFTDCYCAQ